MIRWIVKRFWPRLYRAMMKWQQDDGLTWAASLAYYAAFSFFPLVLVIIAGAGFVLRFSQSAQLHQQQLVKLIGEQTSPKLADEIAKIFSGVQTNAGISGPVGLATLVLGAIGIFMQLEAAFDRIWKINANGDGPKRTLLRILRTVLFTRLRAFLMLIGAGVVVLAAFISNMVVAGISRYAEQLPMGTLLFHGLQLAASAFLNALMFTLLYRVLPKKHVPWLQAIGGGLVAGVAWEIGRQLLALIIVGKSYTAYGVIGSFIVLMLWFYYASMVLLFGAEFVQVGGTSDDVPASSTAKADARNET
jgi:membrane protein